VETEDPMNPTPPIEMPTPAAPRGKDWRAIRDRADGMSLGIEMAASLGLGYYLGYLFDGHFETAPWGTVFFVIAGAGAATKAVVRYYKQAKKIMARKEPGEAVLDAMKAGQEPHRVLRAEEARR
jgi:F0F1-type ATP synthase assembly protein I